MTLSKNISVSQIFTLSVFCVIIGLLLTLYLIIGDSNYLIIVVMAVACFAGVFVYSFSFYDIQIKSNTITVRNAFRTYNYPIEEFNRIEPAKRVLPLMNSPYLAIVFNDRRLFKFIYHFPFFKRLNTNRLQLSSELTEQIRKYINDEPEAREFQ